MRATRLASWFGLLIVGAVAPACHRPAPMRTTLDVQGVPVPPPLDRTRARVLTERTASRGIEIICRSELARRNVEHATLARVVLNSRAEWLPKEMPARFSEVARRLGGDAVVIDDITVSTRGLRTKSVSSKPECDKPQPTAAGSAVRIAATVVRYEPDP